MLTEQELEKLRTTYFTDSDSERAEQNFVDLVHYKENDPKYASLAKAYLDAADEVKRICKEAGDDVVKALRDSREASRKQLQAKFDFMEVYLEEISN